MASAPAPHKAQHEEEAAEKCRFVSRVLLFASLLIAIISMENCNQEIFAPRFALDDALRFQDE